MTSTRRLLPLLVVLLMWASSSPVRGSPESPESSSPSPMDAVKSPTSSGVIIDEAGSRRKASANAAGKMRGRDPPGSPVNLFTPDEFQFYTLNGDGQLVMKQMTKQEIQGMIAAGGGNGGGTNLPMDLGIHHPAQMPNGEPKVSDVIQNVQNVLKSELNKPVKVHTSGSSIPGSVNSQWTNMLPYILSGGSPDQQDVSQETSILLSALEDDQSYVDVVPLQSIRPAEGQKEPESNYFPMQPVVDEQDVKLVTLDPTKVSTDKPIYLLGNMALDSGILDEQETYTLPTKSKPSRPTTPAYHKFTTSLPSAVTIFKDADVYLKNASSEKPTLYIPAAVSPSLIPGSQNQNNYGQPESMDIHTIPGYVSKPHQQVKNITKSPDSGSETANISLKKTPVYISSDSGFTRVPMIQVPVITADRMNTSTQRTNQQQTPMFEILPTISPSSIASTTTKEGSYISKINVGPMGGFKKPETSHKPSIPYRPGYETIMGQNIMPFVPLSSFHHYDKANKSSTVNFLSSTYRPVYESRRPVYKPITNKPSNINTVSSSTHRPVYEGEVKVTQQTVIPEKNSSPKVEVVTKPNAQDGKTKITQYQTYTTGKATSPVLEMVTNPSTQYQTYTIKMASSPVLEIVTKPSTQSGMYKITQYPTYTTGKSSSSTPEVTAKPSIQNEDPKVTQYQTFSTEKTTSPILEIVTKSSTQTGGYKVTQYQTYITKNAPSTVPVTTTKPSSQSSGTTIKEIIDKISDQEKISNDDLQQLLSLSNSQVNKNSDSTTSYVIDKYGQTTVYPDATYELSEKNIENTELNKNEYATDKTSGTYYTTVPIDKSKTGTTYYTTEKPTQSQLLDTVTPSENPSTKTEVYTVNEGTTDHPTIVTQFEESSTKNNYNSYISIEQKDTTKESETTLKQTTNTPVEVTETIIPNYELKDNSESESTSQKSEGENKDTYYIKINYKNAIEESPNTSKIPIKMHTSSVTKPEQTQSSIENEVTTQFVPIEDTTDYTVRYDSNSIHKIEKKPTTNEDTMINKQESTIIMPSKEKSTTQKIEFIDLTTDYSTPIDAIVELANSSDDSKETSNEKETAKPTSNIYEEISLNMTPTEESDESLIATSEKSNNESNQINLKQPTKESVHLIKEDSDTTKQADDKIIVDYLTGENQNKQSNTDKSSQTKPYEIKDSTPISNDEITVQPLYNWQYVSENKKKPVTQSSTGAPENVDTITEGASSKSEPTVSNIKKKEPIQDEEVSTVKVIPVYDDNPSIFTLPLDNLSETTYTLITSTEKSPGKDKPSSNSDKTVNISEQEYATIYQSSSTPNSASGQTETPTLSISTVPSDTTNTVRDTVLPGLQEAFNNYMKEHYDPNLSTADNYDEISHLTTFPTVIIDDSSSNKNKQPSLPSTTSDPILTDTTKYQLIQQNTQTNEDSITKTPNSESTEKSGSTIPAIIVENNSSSKPEEILEFIMQNSTLKEVNTTGYSESKPSASTAKAPAVNNKHNVETPIIYLDVVSSNTDKQNTSHQVNKENMSNSSLTRIKIKNPILDIDKILADTPSQTNTPSTVQYTLPSSTAAANNIASGLIAGYPTYSQGKPMTDFVPYTTSPEITSETKKPSVNKDEEQSKPQGNEVKLSQKNTTVSYHWKPTTLLPSNDEKYVVKVSSIPTDNSEDELSTTYVYQTSKDPNYESYTQIPFESLPIANDTEASTEAEETSFNPPLEKITDLINQLQNSLSDRDSIGYEYSNGIATTIVPLDRFETIINETSSTTNDDTLTTIFDNLSKTSTKSQNNTYVILQTLPWKQTSELYPTSTESVAQYTTRKEPSTVITTPAKSSTKPITSTSATTILSIVKQHVTGKPYVTTTYSTTKGSLENIQSTIDKSAGRINLEEEKNKIQQVKPTEPTRFTMKNKLHYSTIRRPTNDEYSYTRKTPKPATKSTTVTVADYITPKPVVNVKGSSDEKWTLIPQKITSDQPMEVKKTNVKEGIQQMDPQIVTLDHSTGAIGLDQSNKGLDKDVAEFLNMCNEMSFKFWTLANSGLSTSRSVTMSPFGMISTLAMIFLGARGPTSIQMNDILKLDDVVTFNPHLVFQNITDTVTLARGQGIENAAFVRALFADRLKVRRIMPFYKEQAQQFYEGAVVDINFSTAGDILRRRTNLLIRKQTGGRIKDFVKLHTVPLRSPLTALSANVFQTSCDSPDASSEGRDGEMYFAVSQTVKQRKLMPIPAVVWKSGVSAGYEPSLDATAVALGDSKRPVSLIMIMPGQQGVTAPGDNLERLENRLFGNPSENALEKLLKVIIPRRVEVQMPKFSHRSIVNVTSALKKMGFDQLFTKTADLKGINGAGHDLYLADVLQMNLFCTCGDENKLGGRHLSETYPGTSSRHMRAWEIINNINNGVYDRLENVEQEDSEASENSDCNEDNDDDGGDFSGSEDSAESNEDIDLVNKRLSFSTKWNYDSINNLRQKLHMKRLRWFAPTTRTRCRNRRQAEPEKPRMKMDKPFLYLIRHNLTGLILHIGRFNPKNQS